MIMRKTYNISSSSSSSTEMHDKQGQEITKKLYRSISEQAKRLDDVRSCARTIGDLFTPNLQVQRRKLCEYCERLIFSDPILYGRKGEELLWRKSFYDVVATAKKLKNGDYQPDDVANLQAHINSGIGFYHHFLLRLQIDFNFDLSQSIDFPYFSCRSNFISNQISDKDSADKNSNKENKLIETETVNNENKLSNLDNNKIKTKASDDSAGDKLKEWLNYSVHQCLIYLGDLSRYKLEIYPNWEPTLANRYYLQAISFRPEYGMPHNQMGTLAMNQNNYLDAVYHYLRCLACKFPFDGTVNNLHSQFDKNSKFIEQLPKEEENPDADCIVIPSKSDNIKKLIARFLLLIDIWYFNKKVSKVDHLCHQIYKNLEECLTYTKPTNSESGDCDSIETDSGMSYLTNDAIFKLVVISLLTISKMRASHSQNLSMATSFLLAIYSQLLQAITNHIQEAVLNYPLPDEVKNRHCGGIIQDLLNRNKKKSLRRRKKVVKLSSEEEDSEEDSELSENEEPELNYESSSDDSFISDAEDILAASSEDEDEIKSRQSESPVENGKCSPNPPSTSSKTEEVTQHDIIAKVQRMDVNDMLEIITEEGPLQSIKILNDWLRQDSEVLKLCATNCALLLQQITCLLNLVNIGLSSSKVSGISLRISEIINSENKIPLSEDVMLKGVDILALVHKELDWNFVKKRCPTAREESVIRIVKLVSFGKFLIGLQETGVSFDEEKNMFVCKNISKNDGVTIENGINVEVNGKPHPEEGNDIKDKSKEENAGGQQLMKMKHMGQLWLAAEVKALENSVSRGKPSLSPYLVLDADALIKYTYMVKHLVNSRKFIVLVPTAVVSALDDLKREKSEARDAIRWLESQFHQGNRFFRAQRAHESAPIPFIKYPKKKDKEMHIYIKIIECCNFLAEQQKGASNLVTLLIGNQNLLSNGENKEFSYVGLAKSAGIAIESITQFYNKWKKSKGSKR